MISNIITYLNTQLEVLNYFKTLHGIAEQVTDNSKTFPAIYGSNGNWAHIKLEQAEGYHRLVGEQSIEADYDDESLTGVDPTIRIVYPMRFVWCLPRKMATADDNYGLHTIADAIAKKIYMNASTVLNVDLSTEEVSVMTTSHELNQQVVWRNEFTNVDFSLNSKYMMGALDYRVEIIIGEDCWLA